MGALTRAVIIVAFLVASVVTLDEGYVGLIFGSFAMLLGLVEFVASRRR
jgi:divalent metal cation (Fe/Co/Zn/Cd) transporter